MAQPHRGLHPKDRVEDYVRRGWWTDHTLDRVFREQVPIGDAFHRTVRWGSGLQIWFTEGRDFRSPNTQGDGPDKSLWGREQREWLQRTILESDATFKILASPTAIVGPDNANQADGHANAAFAHEGGEFRQPLRLPRRTIAEWLLRNG